MTNILFRTREKVIRNAFAVNNTKKKSERNRLTER